MIVRRSSIPCIECGKVETETPARIQREADVVKVGLEAGLRQQCVIHRFLQCAVGLIQQRKLRAVHADGDVVAADTHAGDAALGVDRVPRHLVKAASVKVSRTVSLCCHSGLRLLVRV